MDIQEKLDDVKTKIDLLEVGLVQSKEELAKLKKLAKEYQKLIDKAKELEK